MLSASGGVVMLQLPPALTVVVLSEVNPSYNITVSPGSPEPVTTGVVTLVMLSPIFPLSEDGDRASDVGSWIGMSRDFVSELDKSGLQTVTLTVSRGL